MEVKIYLYQKCSTCRKALAFLAKHKITPKEVDITEVPPSKTELKAMATHVGSLRKLFNTSGQVYREMKLGQRLSTLSEDEALSLLASNGRLIKRPMLLINQKPVAIGFNETEWSQVLK